MFGEGVQMVQNSTYKPVINACSHKNVLLDVDLGAKLFTIYWLRRDVSKMIAIDSCRCRHRWQEVICTLRTNTKKAMFKNINTLTSQATFVSQTL